MNLMRIAARVAKLRLADDTEDGFIAPIVDFGVSHITEYTLRQSNLPDEFTQPFQGFLRAKESFQSILFAAINRGDSAAIKRVHFAKSGLLVELKGLMEMSQPFCDQWDPAFDTAYMKLSNWEFPDNPEEIWNVDIWVSDCHDLASAVFWALNGPDEFDEDEDEDEPE